MTIQKKSKHIVCAVCKRKTEQKVKYKSTFKRNYLSPETYVSRRIPDKIHFRIVECQSCGLVFSSPICDTQAIISSYKNAEVPLMNDLNNSGKVYTKYLKWVLKKIPSKQRILDIGCGNGFFLRQTKKLGIKENWGVEPSRDSVKNLPKGIDRKKIIVDVFKKKYFKKDFFDLITFFQVFDHVLDPNQFLEDCRAILRPGGYVVAIMHDVNAISHKIMGEASPIFDIQHINLFDKSTIRQIFENNGFVVEKVGTVLTTYSLGYWLKMAPLPEFLKKISSVIQRTEISKMNIALPAGNMVIFARKEDENS